ncbi:MAG: DUF1573 domain-containing protein, partial [Planctomycetaceae bacterium]|nr:DUF1573 domain-containing protein [Planctomycetaceae bacterium]
MARFAYRIAALLAAGPFFVALAAQVAAPRLTPIGAANPKPPLAFHQYAVDLRQVPPRPVIQAHFDFTNVGKAPVNVTRLVPSCGCINPQLRNGKQLYQPGERGRFYVTMQTANEPPGPHAYTVTVQYEDSEPREEIVEFRLALPEVKVSVEPSEIHFYQLSGEDAEQTIYVTDRRGEKFHVLTAECSLEPIKVEVLPVEKSPEGRERTPIRVHVPGDYATGRHRGL